VSHESNRLIGPFANSRSPDSTTKLTTNLFPHAGPLSGPLAEPIPVSCERRCGAALLTVGGGSTTQAGSSTRCSGCSFRSWWRFTHTTAIDRCLVGPQSALLKDGILS